MKSSTVQDYQERIVRTLVYIQQHLDDSLELEQVAAVAAFSRFHFHRVFEGLVGETLKEYTRRLRLERAAGILKRLDPATPACREQYPLLRESESQHLRFDRMAHHMLRIRCGYLTV